MMYYGGVWMWLIWVIPVGLLVWAVIALTRRGGTSYGPGGGKAPLDIAKERYARGEITREEFEEIKKNLAG